MTDDSVQCKLAFPTPGVGTSLVHSPHSLLGPKMPLMMATKFCLQCTRAVNKRC